MEVAVIGLGRMGGNMARRLLSKGHRVVVWNRSPGPLEALEKEGAEPARSFDEVVERLEPPRVAWLMLPAGEVTSHAVEEFARRLHPGDVLVNGANSYYRDSMAYAERLHPRGIGFADVGVSGGIWGREYGYGLMAGGSDEVIAHLRPLLEALAPAPDRGWVHAGPVGAGHYAKMVHNAIEYALMQAYAEGFELLRRKEFDIDLAAVAEAWRHGTVIRSWLLDLIAAELRSDPRLSGVAPVVADSGEGRWAAHEAIDLGVAAPLLALALHERFKSQDATHYPYRVLAVLRRAFGGHAVAVRDATDPAQQEHQGQERA
ncbi:decarboxylating 6-phosphogluconate dehydrogenase [Carboxydochorda subterranea]|uniref:Decarboxylating 6-phosphogluconate dehydrogenase n=1 Tax=Carboxydichorda subterranea TaxID=3109565 RepID=A0ABZ1BYK2_9FIRM|nr:decarboxylating 6-phosphogluconate dehydrogenase [Limnochorda sp. L945t]WRP17173.1 decarboxylating 6-phosphogluconate dehydrogenase [Limnochorda sp. L945t]